MHRDRAMEMNSIRRVLLHGSSDEAFDASARFAARLVEKFGAELHVVYIVEQPLSAGWTAEMAADKLPELHQGIEAEARERLARLLPAGQDSVVVAIRTGDAADELIRYTTENLIDLAIVQGGDRHVHALLDKGRCALLVLRK
ncbi:MAG TPA: universal stress protein [Vicinamibacterales bacterium]|nr:universal stress protein [Vicinamibacterales bacterium]